MSPVPPLALVVEDHGDTRAVYRAALERAGWRVVETDRGDEALVLARSECPAVVLLDISVPGLDGWETARRLKADERTRHARVVAVTGHPLEEDPHRVRASSCDLYLVKPVDPRELLRKLAELTEPAR